VPPAWKPWGGRGVARSRRGRSRSFDAARSRPCASMVVLSASGSAPRRVPALCSPMPAGARAPKPPRRPSSPLRRTRHARPCRCKKHAAWRARLARSPAPVEQQEVGELATADPVSFEQDIKPLFRPEDQQSMAWAFDLSSYDEVKEHATAILARLREG